MDSSPKTRPRRRATQGSSRKTFTLEHANRTLPLVRRIVADIVSQYEAVVEAQRQLHDLPENTPADKRHVVEESSRQVVEKLRDLTEELELIGCELKDWQTGLIDFPSDHDGHPIYLCWRLGEEAVEHWHEIDAGFAGRQKVDSTF